MFKFWQRTPWSIENLCTFFVQTCTDCARFWDPDLRDAARPNCILPSFYAAMAQKRYDAGNPFDSDLPEWFPQDCPHHMDK